MTFNRHSRQCAKRCKQGTKKRKPYEGIQVVIIMITSRNLIFNKLASLESPLVQNYDPPTN